MPESAEKVAEEMYAYLAKTEATGKMSTKPGDLTKAMIAKLGEAACSKDICKQAIRLLIESERCVYNYSGGSYIQLNPAKAKAQGA